MSDDARTPRSYRPGSWYGVLGDPAQSAASLLLPPGERARVAALWELVDGGAGFDEVLDALLAGGLSDLEGFVLWSVADDLMQVVVRGPARVVLTTADGEDVLDGASAATWAERRVRGVRSTSVEIEDVDGPDLGVVSGLVRVGRVDEPAYAAAPDEADVAAVPEVEDESTEPADPVASEDVTGLEGSPEPLAEEPEIEEPEIEPLAPPREPRPQPTLRDGLSLAPVAPTPDPLSDPLPDPVHAQPDPDDEQTEQLAPGAWQPTGPALPGIPGQPQAPAVTSRPVARLVLSNGATVEVDRAVLVGRSPEARRFGAAEQPRLVTVPSPHQEISSTHLEVRPGSGADHGSAVVTDLGSTNGTVLVQPGLPPESLQPGIAVQLIPGAIIDLGDGVTIQVTNV
ncbi:FHA domain-containing protein [Nocardioides bigeumensis]|uniref:FHA domain-containing protein n=1 Tax=Nocardioides bigeumensis TaxID=433657 RepID=A0ABN2YI62_9ACTN